MATLLLAAGACFVSAGGWIYMCYVHERYIKNIHKQILQMQVSRVSQNGNPHTLLWNKIHPEKIPPFPSISDFDKHLSRSNSKRKDHVKFNIDGEEITE